VDLLPEIKEDDADGITAAYYDDIRAVIGVPIVNLIFRNMATVPGCLEWAWTVVRPLYVSGAIPLAAEKLTDAVLPGKTVDLSGPIAAEGLNSENIGEVARVLDSYGRANPMNAISLNVLDLILDHSARKSEPFASKPLVAEVLLKPEGLKTLLPMVDPATAPDRTQTALTRLAIQIHGGNTGVIPSLYRHFGAWPVFLESLESAIEHALSDGIQNASQEMLKNSQREALNLYNGLSLPKMSFPDETAIKTLNRLITHFPPNICRLTVLATLLRRGLQQTNGIECLNLKR